MVEGTKGVLRLGVGFKLRGGIVGAELVNEGALCSRVLSVLACTAPEANTGSELLGF